jgi:hypothetical protein
VPLRVVNVTWTDLRALALHSPFLEPDLDCEEMDLKFLGGYGGITVHG